MAIEVTSENLEAHVSDYITADRSKKTYEGKMKELRDPLIQYFSKSGPQKVKVSNGSLSAAYIKSEDFDLEQLAKLHPDVFQSCSGITFSIPAGVVSPDDIEQLQALIEQWKFSSIVKINKSLDPNILKEKLESEEIEFSSIEDCFGIVKEQWRFTVGK